MRERERERETDRQTDRQTLPVSLLSISPFPPSFSFSLCYYFFSFLINHSLRFSLPSLSADSKGLRDVLVFLASLLVIVYPLPSPSLSLSLNMSLIYCLLCLRS